MTEQLERIETYIRSENMNILFFLTPKSDVAFLYEDFTLRQALEKMEHRKYSAIPVLSREGEYIDTITEGDILWEIIHKYDFNMAKAERVPLTEIKRRMKVEAVSIDTKIEDLMLKSMGQNFVPVIDDKKKFIGIVTRKDILQYCYGKLNQSEQQRVQKQQRKMESSY